MAILHDLLRLRSFVTSSANESRRKVFVSLSLQGKYRIMATNQRKFLGRYIVVDPAICHGKPTFLGTRIMVAQVLKQIAKGMSWDAIMAEWWGTVTRDA